MSELRRLAESALPLCDGRDVAPGDRPALNRALGAFERAATPSVVIALLDRVAELEGALHLADKAIRPFAGCVFNDNGDMAVSRERPHSREEYIQAYFAGRRARRRPGKAITMSHTAGWFELHGDSRLTKRCATEGCGGQPTWRMEADGIGSDYCSGCKSKIEAAQLTSPDQAATADDMNLLDEVVHVLGIEDSHTTPAEAVRSLHDEITRLRAELDVTEGHGVLLRARLSVAKAELTAAEQRADLLDKELDTANNTMRAPAEASAAWDGAKVVSEAKRKCDALCDAVAEALSAPAEASAKHENETDNRSADRKSDKSPSRAGVVTGRRSAVGETPHVASHFWTFRTVFVCDDDPGGSLWGVSMTSEAMFSERQLKAGVDAIMRTSAWNANVRMTRDDALVFARAALAAAEKEAWRPIEEAPKDRDTVLVVGIEGIVSEAQYHPEEDGWWLANTDPTDFYDGKVAPTHFRPLPEPPAIANKPEA